MRRPAFQPGVRWRRLFYIGRERKGSQFGIRRWKERRSYIYAWEAARAALDATP